MYDELKHEILEQIYFYEKQNSPLVYILLKIKMFISTYVKKIKYRRNRWMYLINMVKNLLMFMRKIILNILDKLSLKKL